MTTLRELNISLLDWEARYILEALSRELERLRVVSENAADEDAAADAGNDYLELIGLKERFESEAKAVFGDQIVNFSRDGG
ncbi:MAG: hypothetical protein WDA11_06005 [Thiohalomonadaceae bacterium]